MFLGLGFGLVRRAGSGGQIITATVQAVLAQLSDTDTPADGFTSGTYTSTAGIIDSVVTTYFVNDLAAASDTALADGDTVRAEQMVSDSAGNARLFTTITVRVGAPLFDTTSVTVDSNIYTFDQEAA